MRSILNAIVTQELAQLREVYLQEGFDIRIVGGAVRDSLSGKIPHDVDLCTDANPDEQLAIYEKHNIQCVPTGVEFGTYTVILGNKVEDRIEITSLRTEAEHDGRHAVMRFTKDWKEDLSRRDLTINAMSLSFDGDLFDPFGGKDDLENAKVRFVGVPQERMTEDYLRIMRFYRFLGRYGEKTNWEIDDATYQAIMQTKHGLADISGERIWKELQQIIQHPSGLQVFLVMKNMGIFDVVFGRDIFYIGSTVRNNVMSNIKITQPIVKLASALDARTVLHSDVLDIMANRLRLSSWDKQFLKEFAAVRDSARCLNSFKECQHEVIVAGKPQDIVAAVQYATASASAEAIEAWQAPAVPAVGKMLLERGVKPGPMMGKQTRAMKAAWVDSDFTMSEEEMVQVGLQASM